MSWTLAGNLGCRTDAVLDEYPGTTIWAIGDPDHQSGQSDHNEDARSMVHAIDVMVYDDHALGQAVCDWARSFTDDLEYIIWDRHIYSRSNDFAERDYTGSNPHEDHVHLSGKHGSTGYSERTGTGYDTAAEAMRPPGFTAKRVQGGEMFLFTVEGNANVWKSNGFKRALFSGPDTGGVNTYQSYRPLTDAGVPMAAYSSANIDAMGLSVDEALDWVGGKQQHADD